ncbi:MAG TPA: M13 family metallopeptidase [Terriglobales bacterium]|jgi:endothelin-converting enzyme/putative endopeptidase|nr:M13 family metallopeptidase [Terriglobales bacterium]
MRSCHILLFAMVTIPCLAQKGEQRGIYVGDLDRTVDPCMDFFEYSNGTWRKQNPIPSYMDRWSRRWKAGEDAKDQLKTILDDVSGRTDWKRGSVEQLVGDYYGACMDEQKVDRLGFTPAMPLLKEIDAINSQSDLEAVLLKLHELGIFVPFATVAAPDNHDPSSTITDLAAAGLGLPDRDYYLKPEPRFKDAREKYLVHVTNMFKLIGYDDPAAKKAAQTVFAMEKSLAENSLDNVALRDPANTDHKTSMGDLRKLTPSFDWDRYFSAAGLPRADLNVDEPKFMQEVDRQVRETSLADWKTYLKWQLVHGQADVLSRPFVEENFAFYGAYLSGAKELKPRWKRCAESTDQLLGEALGQKYVEKYFPPEAKTRALEMVNNILAAMRDTINGLQWMGPDTKKKALAKLAAVNVKIGYPDKWKDYSSIPITRDSFWDNQVAAAKWNVVEDTWALAGKPTDRSRWGMTPPTSNAYYNPLLNEIVFPAAILQPPAFDVGAVDAVNYGAIGVVIGHEISHGFDDQGAKFAADGKLENWWTADDEKRFEGRTMCVAHQFDNYFIEPGIHHNGKLVLGESIGDLAGAKIAYLAYQKAKQQHPAPTLDGLTPDQQFFIAWGQFRGDEIRPETQRKMVQGDPHPIARYRVIGPISNLPAFGKAFSCKQGAAMVRPEKERCEVW